jgi:hypothetical protein
MIVTWDDWGGPPVCKTDRPGTLTYRPGTLFVAERFNGDCLV